MNTSTNDGGSAFPFGQISELTGQPINGWFAPGMTLRDWFAGREEISNEEVFSWELCEALAGPRPDKDRKTDPIGWEIWQSTWQARVRFIRADAMLAAREWREEKK